MKWNFSISSLRNKINLEDAKRSKVEIPEWANTCWKLTVLSAESMTLKLVQDWPMRYLQKNCWKTTVLISTNNILGEDFANMHLYSKCNRINNKAFKTVMQWNK